MGEPRRCQFLQIPEDIDEVPSWSTDSTEFNGAGQIPIHGDLAHCNQTEKRM